MKLLDMTHGRHTYSVELSYSPLFESVLGIAAMTYTEIHPTLEKSPSYWEELALSLPLQLREDLLYAQTFNTWKTLLQLLHEQSFADLDAFLDYIPSLSAQALRFQALPFLGMEKEELRYLASTGDQAAKEELIQHTSAHKFYPSYIRHLCEGETEGLRTHLIRLMSGWYYAQIAPSLDQLKGILHRDWAKKQELRSTLAPEAFVEWATGGIHYPPEPEMTRVLLIPQTIYRPWTIQADAIRTKIFYYPVADESLEEIYDPYRPSFTLIHRFKALGDEHRLRIVKLLHDSDHSLQLLTEKLGISKSTVHHHLSLLRSAQLVETIEGGYRLKRTQLAALQSEWQHYLERKEEQK